jgi:hypothetical protein
LVSPVPIHTIHTIVSAPSVLGCSIVSSVLTDISNAVSIENSDPGRLSSSMTRVKEIGVDPLASEVAYAALQIGMLVE